MNESFSEPRVSNLETAGFWARLALPFRGNGPGLFVGLGILPTLIGLGIVFCYIGEWGDGVWPVFYGGIGGVIAWLVISVLFLRKVGRVTTADSAAYEDLLPRLIWLEKQLEGSSAGRDPRGEAAEHVKLLRAALRQTGKPVHGDNSLRWLGGYGYISLWRHVHRAEEVLLETAPVAELRIAAMEDVARLRQASVDSNDVFGAALRKLLDDTPAARKSKGEGSDPPDDAAPPTPPPGPDVDARLDQPQGRALVRQARFILNCYRDDLRQGLVLLRNLMFETMVYTSFVCVGLLALAVGVLGENYKEHVATALAYYMIGALVGLFAELYVRSRRSRGVVHDFGLAHARVLTVPVLSGIAAVGGVVLARLGGTAGTDDDITLEDVFLLGEYPFGVVVAAIFGLTPGLLLARLKTETDEYEKALAESGPAQVAAESSTSESKPS